jgi:hypothetical protein
LPLPLPKSFSVLPWCAIHHVEMHPVNYVTMDFFFRVYLNLEGPEFNYFEIGAGGLRFWTKEFQACGVTVVGAEKILTLAGFWKENWANIWVGMVGLGTFGVIFFFTSFFWGWWVVLHLLGMGLWIVMMVISKENKEGGSNPP